MTSDELARERRRRGYWLKIARLEANLNQAEVARQLGLSEKSGSSVNAWETGKRDPTASQLSQLARLYGVPVALFADPQPTDAERVAAARADLARAAILLAHEDLEAELEQGPGAGAPRDEQPGRRSA